MRKIIDNRLRVFDSEIGARGLANVLCCWYPGSVCGLVWVVDEMNHTKLQRVIWRALSEMTTTDEKVGNVNAKMSSMMLLPTEVSFRRTV
jgi:hypothetical protein